MSERPNDTPDLEPGDDMEPAAAVQAAGPASDAEAAEADGAPVMPDAVAPDAPASEVAASAIEPIVAETVEEVPADAVVEAAPADEVAVAETPVVSDAAGDAAGADEMAGEGEADDVDAALEGDDEFENGPTGTEEPDGDDLEGSAALPARPMSPSERRAARAGLASGQIPIDPALRIKDRASAIFVVLSVAVFAIILANALVFGHGGLLAPRATPTPVPSVTAAPTVAPTATAAPTAPTATAAPTVTPAAS